ncbi:uncharacterized protein LOC135152676 [Daucus carota subsp. sativus]|uniref:uncharacterized protein LOC135152676 n=1 Tax=Daucus carota subsp. sativus TaxID=79200 RepID=UPI0030836946
MDSDQTLLALQNTYADGFLNTSNQEAAKVLAAERKAQQLEQELQVTKDKSAQMMSRLNKMLDDKVFLGASSVNNGNNMSRNVALVIQDSFAFCISEANMASRNQHERIEELEAQVREAEDIVRQLREELRCVRDQHKRVSTKDLQHAGKQLDDKAPPEEAMVYNRQLQSVLCNPLESATDSLVGSDKENLYPHHRTPFGKCTSEAIQMWSLYGPMPELPSILQRSKEHRLYKSRCAHCIEAKMPTKHTQALCKDDCICCLYEIHTTDLILKAAKSATNTMYKKKKPASSKKIPERLFQKVHESRGVPDESESATKSVGGRAKPIEGPILPKGPSRECSKIQVCTQNVIKVSQPTPPPDLNSNGTSAQASSLQHFRYTYQRKRKRETRDIISDGNLC